MESFSMSNIGWSLCWVISNIIILNGFTCENKAALKNKSLSNVTVININSLPIFTLILFAQKKMSDEDCREDSEQKKRRKQVTRMRKRMSRPLGQKSVVNDWDQMDQLEANDQIQVLRQSVPKKNGTLQPKPVNRKEKKFTELEMYQSALAELRKDNQKFYRPFERNRLSISLMTAIKMLNDAIDRDTDFQKTLRQMGCKTRMRVRNKQAAVQLFQVMLQYLKQSNIPNWMKHMHQQLLKKEDNQFDEEFMKLEGGS